MCYHIQLTSHDVLMVRDTFQVYVLIPLHISHIDYEYVLTEEDRKI